MFIGVYSWLLYRQWLHKNYVKGYNGFVEMSRLSPGNLLNVEAAVSYVVADALHPFPDIVIVYYLERDGV